MQLNKKTQIVLSMLFIGAIAAWLIAAPIIHKRFHEHVRSQRKMYCYETYAKVVNRALYVKHESLIDSVVGYYQKMEAGNIDAGFNFPPLQVPYDTSVYVMGYNADSTAAEIVCYGRFTKSSFIQGYVSVNTLHETPPPDSLITKK